jgi:hypothetical protein
MSTPLLSRDNTARKGRDWAKVVAQTLQRARFQALAERTNIHVLLFRTHIDIYRMDAAPVLLSSTPGPAAAGLQTVAIWAANKTGTTPSQAELTDPTGTSTPSLSPTIPTNDIAFSPLGSTTDNSSWWVYLRNELLLSNHPDASFLVTVRGLTGFVSANNKVTLP